MPWPCFGLSTGGLGTRVIVEKLGATNYRSCGNDALELITQPIELRLIIRWTGADT